MALSAWVAFAESVEQCVRAHTYANDASSIADRVPQTIPRGTRSCR